jgi:hypothetical protein
MSVRKILDKVKISEVDIEALIDKGAKVKEDFKLHESEWFYVKIRIPTKMVRAVDRAVKNKVGIQRTGWILQAIHEKLTRDETLE